MLRIVDRLRGKIRDPKSKCIVTAAAAFSAAALSTLFDDPATGAAVGSGAITTLTEVGKQFFGTFQDVANDNCAGAVADVLPLTPEHEQFQNHHVTRLIGKAIAAIIREKAEEPENFESFRQFAQSVATKAETEWATFEEDNSEPLTENEITALFSLGPEHSKQVQALTPDFWTRSLTQLMMKEGGAGILMEDEKWSKGLGQEPGINKIGRSIADNLYGKMITLLVNDAGSAGKAFADVVFKLLTELCRLQHLVVRDVNASKVLLKALGKALSNVEGSLEAFAITERKAAAAILRHVHEVNQNILVLGLDAAETSQKVTQIESKLNQLLNLRLPNTIPTLSRWIETRHDTATLTQNRPLTETARHILELQKEGKRHFLIIGKIASGKSTTVSDVAAAVMRESTSPAASAVLPLGIDYAIDMDSGWSRTQLVGDLATYLNSLSPQEKREHLILVDDSHAAAAIIPSFTGNHQVCLHDSHVFVTCRAGAEEVEKVVEKRMRDYWEVSPEKIYLDPAASAVQMINAALLKTEEVEQPRLKLAFEDVLHACGQNLFILKTVIHEWKKNPQKEISMELAYAAVRHELSRVAKHVSQGNESAEDRAKLVIIWMISGLDLPVSCEFLSTYFGIDVSHAQIQSLRQEKEIADVEEDAFSVSRHPAWGLLVLKAIDDEDFDGLNRERSFIVEGFKVWTTRTLQDVARPALARDWKASESLLFALLCAARRQYGIYADLVTTDNLAFTCSGKHVSDEFASAVQVLMDCKEAEGVPRGSLGEEMNSIANTLRRVRSDTADQQIIAWNSGLELIEEAISHRKAEFGNDLMGDPLAGRILYQRGYYEYLLGDFATAKATFATSAEHEVALEERRVFAGMSKVMEANSSLALGKTDEAENLAEEALALIAADSTKHGPQFRANAFATQFEVRLRRRQHEAAHSAFLRYKSELEKTAILGAFGVGQARLAILERSFNAALNYVERIRASAHHMSYAETMIQTYRVKGDCLLALDKYEEAEREYRYVLPLDLSQGLSFEHQLILDRLSRMKNEGNGADILASSML